MLAKEFTAYSNFLARPAKVLPVIHVVIIPGSRSPTRLHVAVVPLIYLYSSNNIGILELLYM